MATDKKGQHVGNHGGAYTDNDGMSRQFTYIDHDKHTTRTKSGREAVETVEEKEKRIKELTDSISLNNQKRIDEILAMPAVAFAMSGNTFSEDCIIRDEKKGIIWDETFTRNFLTIRTDMIYVISNIVWKRTVKEQNWDVELTHDQMMAGEWKKLM